MRAVLAAILMLTAPALAERPLAPVPLIIAHRGASGERPEHTLAAYKLAIEEGANYVEPDLVMTKDGVMVARHENEIGGTTDVARHPEFASRKTTKTVDGEKITGWFTEDFTLAELKTLRARTRLPKIRPAVAAAWDGKFPVPTFDEILDLVAQERARTGRRIGVYPEIKHSTYFKAIGLPMEHALVDHLVRAGYTHRDDPIFIQSFEIGNLQALRKLTPLHLIQLIDEEGGPADRIAAGDRATTYAGMLTPAGLAAIARYADAIGPSKAQIVPRDAAGRSLAPTSLIHDAHAAGLLVHPWTFRDENDFLPLELKHGTDPAAHGDFAAEYRQFFALGVDGLFSEFPVDARAALNSELASKAVPTAAEFHDAAERRLPSEVDGVRVMLAHCAITQNLVCQPLGVAGQAKCTFVDRGHRLSAIVSDTSGEWEYVSGHNPRCNVITER